MKITFKGAEALRTTAKGLRKLPDENRRALARAVNQVVAKVATQSRRDIGAQINLPQSYIREQMTVSKAGYDRPVASIRMRMRAVRLARFAAKQLTVQAKHRNVRKLKGDAMRGIAAGRKAAGTSVSIVRGARTKRKAGFLVPLRAGQAQGDNLGVFVRTGKGPKDIEHKYGPSPDQLFRRWAEEQTPDIQQMLLEAYDSQLRYELTGSRK
ncbi:MAG TPA: phage tail protein [Azoarcus taiwanensis]|nr:phage tail protein [Azoarcus taiwanensis]